MKGCDHSCKDLIWTSVDDKYSGSMKISTHLSHSSHCQTASVQIDRIDGPEEHLSYILAAVTSLDGCCNSSYVWATTQTSSARQVGGWVEGAPASLSLSIFLSHRVDG